MKIVVVGTRGIPEIQGGVETHCQELYPRLAAMGHDVTVVCRSCYVTHEHPTEYCGVKLAVVAAPRRKSLEAIVHTWRALRLARRMKPDLVHIHAIGPGLLVPMAKLMGLRVVSTNHGPDYDRAKWGRLAKAMLKMGERMSARYSDRVIVISRVIADILARRYGRTDTTLIYNGVTTPTKSANTNYIEAIGLKPGRYILGLGRLVPEKGFHDLVAAFTKANLPADVKLVIAGDADHPDAYSEKLREDARKAGVVMTGFIRGEKLNQLLTNARLFAMPSYHEGLPIALLEAMSYGLDVAVADIPACLIPELDPSTDFFTVGDVDGLARLLERKSTGEKVSRSYDLSAYDWDHIALQTSDLYQSLKQPK